MDAHWWMKQVTTRVGAVTCWIQQPVPPKQVVGFTCVFNSEVDQLTWKLIVLFNYRDASGIIIAELAEHRTELDQNAFFEEDVVVTAGADLYLR